MKSRTRIPARGADEASLFGSDIRLFQVELLLGLLKQVTARHLRQRNLLLETATVQFILNQILERLIRQAAVGAVARKIVLKGGTRRGKIQSQPLCSDADRFFLMFPDKFEGLDGAFDRTLHLVGSLL